MHNGMLDCFLHAWVWRASCPASAGFHSQFLPTGLAACAAGPWGEGIASTKLARSLSFGIEILSVATLGFEACVFCSIPTRTLDYLV